MKHASTRAVYDYWNKQRRHRPAPERGDIDPVEIRHALGDTFMLTADFTDRLRFRLAGTRVCALFGRELKGEAFTALWSEASWTAGEQLLRIVTEETSGVVAGLTALSEQDEETDLEMLLLPIAHSGHARIRALGVMVPSVPPYWLGAQAVTELSLVGFRHLRPQPKSLAIPQFGQATESGRMRHGFMVYRGGRESSAGERTG
jgi:hypothetical protein